MVAKVENGTNNRLLMVEPSEIYFKPEEQDFDECHTKWSAARRALKDIGVQIIQYNSAEEYAPRSPYSRDRYLSIQGMAFVPDPAANPHTQTLQTRGAIDNDVHFFMGILGRVHDEVIVTHGVWFETGNLIVDEPGKTIFGGVHTMEDLSAFKKLEQVMSRHVTGGWMFEPLTMAPGIVRNPNNPNSHWFYHLDLAQSERIADDTVMFCREAFTYSSQRKLELHFNGSLVDVSLEDAKAGAINCVSRNGSVIPTSMSDDLEDTLSDRGITVVDPRDYGVDDFMVVNGGVHCLTNEV